MRLRRLLLIALLGVVSLVSQERDGAMRVWWLDNIKSPLSKPGGAKLFDEQYRETLLPPAGLSFRNFKGRIVSIKPALNPAEIILAVVDPGGDAKLVFKKPLPGSMPVGSELSFKGVPIVLTQDPFVVTFDMNDEEIEGPELVGWKGR